MTPLRRNSTSAIFLAVARFMGKHLIYGHTYAGTQERDPSFVPGPSVGNASHALMSCRDTRGHTRVSLHEPDTAV